MNIQKILKNRTVRNAGWIIAGRLVNKVLAILVGFLTARYLGPGNYGLINYAATYTTFFASLCTLGIDSVIIKNFVDHPEQEGEALGTAIGLRALSSIFSVIMILGFVSIADRDEPLTILVVALSSVGMVFQVFDSFSQWFQSRLQSQYAAIAGVVSYVVVSAYKIYLLATGKSVVWFALATSVDHLVVAFFLIRAYRKNNGPRLSFSMTKARELLQASSGFILSGLMISIYASTDRLMLKQMLDDAAVGYYGAAVTLSTAWGFLLHAVIDSVQPSVIQAYGKDRQLFQKRNRQLYALILYGAGSVSLGIFLLAKPIILILYGESYRPAIEPLRILIWYTAFSYLGVARNIWMVCENKQHYLKKLYMYAAITNVILNYLLIPQWGPSGAAMASLVTQFVTTIFLPLCMRPLRSNAVLMLEALTLKNVFDHGNETS